MLSILGFRVMAARLVLTCTFTFWGAATIKVCQNNKTSPQSKLPWRTSSLNTQNKRECEQN